MKKALIVLSILFLLAVPMASASFEDFFEKFFDENVITGGSFVSTVSNLWSSSRSPTVDPVSIKSSTVNPVSITKPLAISKTAGAGREEAAGEISTDETAGLSADALTDRPGGGQYARRVLKEGTAMSLKNGKIQAKIETTFKKNGKDWARVRFTHKNLIVNSKFDITSDGIDDYVIISKSASKIVLRKIETTGVNVLASTAHQAQAATAQAQAAVTQSQQADTQSQQALIPAAAEAEKDTSAVSRVGNAMARLFG